MAWYGGYILMIYEIDFSYEDTRVCLHENHIVILVL